MNTEPDLTAAKSHGKYAFETRVVDESNLATLRQQLKFLNLNPTI